MQRTEKDSKRTGKDRSLGGFESRATSEDGAYETTIEVVVPDYVVRDSDAPDGLGEAYETDECYMSVREAARVLGVGQREVRELAAWGRLETKKGGLASRLMVLSSSVQRLRSEPEPAHQAREEDTSGERARPAHRRVESDEILRHAMFRR
jgi:excisionase family DNA binding protein